jgi:suppressor of tumorigenicity protein 13
LFSVIAGFIFYLMICLFSCTQARKLEEHQRKYERLHREKEQKDRQDRVRRAREEHSRAAKEQDERRAAAGDEEEEEGGAPGNMGDFYKLLNDPELMTAFQVNYFLCYITLQLK